MLAKRLSAVALVLLAFVLTGCGGKGIIDLYVQDIIEVVEGVDEQLLTSAVISVESPGEDYNQQMIELLELNFRNATNARTVSQDYSTYVVVDVKVPILTLDDYAQLWENDDALGIVVFDTEDGSAAFGLGLNSDKLDELFGAFNEQVWESVTIDSFSFTIKLYNDTRNSVFASLQGVYVNQVPIAYEEVFEMARRDILDIRLGDVARDAAYQDGLVVIGVLEF